MEDEKELYDLNQLESNFNKVTGKDILMLNQDQIDELLLYVQASKAYYDEEAIMSDVEFDVLSEKLVTIGLNLLKLKFTSQVVFSVLTGTIFKFTSIPLFSILPTFKIL